MTRLCFLDSLHSGRTSTGEDDRNLDKSYNQPCIRPSYLRPRPSGPRLSLIRADWWQCSLTSDMHTPQGLWVIEIFFNLVRRERKKKTDRERKARQDLTLHQLNDAEPC